MKQSILFEYLLDFVDNDYKQFTCTLIPNVDPDKILGIRIHVLREFSKRLSKEHFEKLSAFLVDLPHFYYDENNLHGLLISEQKDFNQVICSIDCFLPHVDNWATCDIIRPKIFKNYKNELIPNIKRWISSDHEYTIRFGIEMLMTHYLDESFKTEYLDLVASIKNDAYYVKMMIAWFFATALTKQYNQTISIIEKNKLDLWIHNKTIQKSRESRKISNEHKSYLSLLKRNY